MERLKSQDRRGKEKIEKLKKWQRTKQTILAHYRITYTSWRQYHEAHDNGTIDLGSDKFELKKMGPKKDYGAAEKKRIELAVDLQTVADLGKKPQYEKVAQLASKVVPGVQPTKKKIRAAFKTSETHSQNSAKPVSQNKMEAYTEDNMISFFVARCALVFGLSDDECKQVKTALKQGTPLPEGLSHKKPVIEIFISLDERSSQVETRREAKVFGNRSIPSQRVDPGELSEKITTITCSVLDYKKRTAYLLDPEILIQKKLITAALAEALPAGVVMQYSESGGTTKETWPLTVKRVLEDVKRPNPESDPTRWLISSDLPTVHQCGEAVELVEEFGPTWQAIATQGSGAFQREDAKSIHNKIDQLYQKLVAEHQKQTGESLLAQQAVLFSIQAYQSISTWDVLKAANEVGEPVPGETLAQTLIKQTRVIRDKCVTPASFHEDIEQRLAELAEDEKTPAHYKEVFAELLKELIAKLTDIQDEKKQQRLKRQQLKDKKNAFKLGPNRQVTGAGVVEALKAQEEERKRNQEEKEEKRRAKAAKAADKKIIEENSRAEET